MKSFIFITLQYLTPQHLLSRCVGWFAATKIHWIKSLFINKFVATYKVNMNEAENSDPNSYACFNDFFCRPLKPDARPIDSTESGIVSPADGAFSQLGPINDGRIFQAKGHDFSAYELLGGDHNLAKEFTNGEFATIYLSPKDYHRLHMPITGELISMCYVPGDLFSVNPTTTENVPRLFARNERVICVFKTEIGPVALVLVGAMIVASIETIWAGQVAPIERKIHTTNYGLQENITLQKGEEMGRFKLGSTIVMLFPENSLEWSEEISADSSIKMGELIAQYKKR
ncbi:archaetidylserine decarboxylase [Agarilytica rhodophyticola]|uniref:archaetidylserine decarboxylase n=1 Tax=Agarilytica rhodophyticola TaxID=1737490 RepID=UPI000B3434CA|nr:archaetidylserine decarboxylase [Agarilytica rhodophyticola]